jgi:monovalent cation:H+ antiporter-2, CPA2 family
MASTFASPTLSDALVILGAAGIAIPLFARIRITPIIGFLLVGVLIGPHGLGKFVTELPWLVHVTIPDEGGRSHFATLAIILLLFSGGLDLSFDRLHEMRRQVFGLGALELLVNSALLIIGLKIAGYSLFVAWALGSALAMSSTALVTRITRRGTPVGRATLAMLLFEDIALIPAIILLDALAPFARTGDWAALSRSFWLGLLALVALLAAGRFILPRLFAQAARTKSPELFLATSLLVVVVTAVVTSAVGLSLIAGALIAGLLIAGTAYHGEVEAMMAPFKGLALGVFLIAMGMDIDLVAVWDQIGRYLIATALVLLLKALVTGLLLRIMGARPGTSTEAGLLMAAPSETTLIVLTAAATAQLIDKDTQVFWQTVTAFGLLITPLLAPLASRLALRVETAMPEQVDDDIDKPRAVIVGFGRVGRLVADMLKVHGKPYVALDGDADNVAEAQRSGYNVRFGDAARGQALTRLGIDHATAAILTMDDPVGSQQLVHHLRTRLPQLPIIARARDPGHAALLYKAGASHAVPETLEASLQLSEAVLVDLGVAMGPVIASIHEKRDEFRAQIMHEGELAEKPVLKSGGLRERAG